MINIAETKLGTQAKNQRTVKAPKKSSDIFRTQYSTDYEMKKEREKKEVHAEIKRTSEMESFV